MMSLVDYALSDDEEDTQTKNVAKETKIENNTKSNETIPIEIPENEDEIVGEADRPLHNEIDYEDPNKVIFKSTLSAKEKSDPFSKFSLFGEKGNLGKRAATSLIPDDSNGPLKKKATIKIPINLKKTENNEEIEEDEDLKPLRSLRSLNENSEGLSFLPAPKNKSMTFPSKSKQGLPPLSDDFLGEEENPTLKVRSTKSRQAANVLNRVFGNSDEHNNENELEPEREEDYNQSAQQAQYDPQYEAYHQGQHQQAAQYNKPHSSVPKDFQGMNPNKMIQINAHDLYQSGSTPAHLRPAAEADFIPDALKQDTSGEAWAPSKNHRRTNHASYLIWDLKNKLPELEAKRAEGARNRREAKNKYGW